MAKKLKKKDEMKRWDVEDKARDGIKESDVVYIRPLSSEMKTRYSQCTKKKSQKGWVFWCLRMRTRAMFKIDTSITSVELNYNSHSFISTKTQ